MLGVCPCDVAAPRERVGAAADFGATVERVAVGGAVVGAEVGHQVVRSLRDRWSG
jgi:hypothetical protein